MRSARAALVLGNLALGAAVAATYSTGIGRTRAHDHLAYFLLVAAAALALPLLRHRRAITLLMASAGAWSALTGLFLLYVSPWISGGRWMTWWHGVTSVAFALAFLAHWGRNNARLVDLARRLGERRAAASLVAALWLLGLLVALLSYAEPRRASFSEPVYYDAADVSLLAALALGVAGPLLARAPALRRRLARGRARDRGRGATDASLLLAMWLATLTGFALLDARALRAADAYWLTTAWHVAVSALLLMLVAWHVTFNVRPLASHAR